MINLDTFLEIGNSHKVCEDYIIQGELPTPYIILADGCSMSKDSEVGARILTHLAKQYLIYHKSEMNLPSFYQKLGSWVIHNAELIARQLGIKLSCLNATLIVAFKNEDSIKILMYGDGVIIRKTGEDVIVTIVDFKPINAPYYLSYQVNAQDDMNYYTMKNSKYIKYGSDGAWLEELSQAYDFPTEISYKINEIDTLFICSDGILSFIKDQEKESIFNYINTFLAFKNINGEYLKRRMNRALEDITKAGFHHFDDLSIGSFLVVKED